MTKARAIVTVAFVFLCCSLSVPTSGLETDQIQPRSYSLPNHGKFVLSVPSTWKHNIRQPPEDVPPTIVLSPGQGDDFKIFITPLWSPSRSLTFNKSTEVKRLVENDLKGMLPGAVETQVLVQEFSGNDGTGYYFQVTGKAPKPGEYAYAVRAGIGVGDLLLSVTVLSRTKNSEGLTSTIIALAGAKQLYK